LSVYSPYKDITLVIGSFLFLKKDQIMTATIYLNRKCIVHPFYDRVILVPPPSRVRSSMCTSVTPAVPYLLLGLQGVQWAMGNSRGARKLARTAHVNQKKKNTDNDNK